MRIVDNIASIHRAGMTALPVEVCSSCARNRHGFSALARLHHFNLSRAAQLVCVSAAVRQRRGLFETFSTNFDAYRLLSLICEQSKRCDRKTIRKKVLTCQFLCHNM